jgi:hypothetical protein
MARGLDWQKARQTERARPVPASWVDRTAPITDKQRSYVKTLQSITGSSEPMPRSRAGASHLIDSLNRRAKAARTPPNPHPTVRSQRHIQA